MCRMLSHLRTAQRLDIVDSLNSVRVHVTTKVAFTEHSQPLFEAQMEPIAQGDPVPCSNIQKQSALELHLEGGFTLTDAPVHVCRVEVHC